MSKSKINLDMFFSSLLEPGEIALPVIHHNFQIYTFWINQFFFSKFKYSKICLQDDFSKFKIFSEIYVDILLTQHANWFDRSWNFKRAFLETTFFKRIPTITHILLDRFIWNFRESFLSTCLCVELAICPNLKKIRNSEKSGTKIVFCFRQSPFRKNLKTFR